MSSIIDHPPALELKGGLYTLTAIRIYSADPQLLTAQLENKIKQAPKFFYCAPVIIDLSKFKEALPKNSEDLLKPILNCIRQFQLIPIGIVPMESPSEDFLEAARILGMAIMSDSRKMPSQEPIQKMPYVAQENRVDVVEAPMALPQFTPTRTLIQPVRSGQQIYAPNGDLLVLNSVSHGAELLADGHIHVYGPLRGRALAGISGDEETHIFCQSLEAELVSIAGRYKISEDLKDNPLWKQPVRIFLEKGKLQITKL
jgi:septum site-determining protein MinC